MSILDHLVMIKSQSHPSQNCHSFFFLLFFKCSVLLTGVIRVFLLHYVFFLCKFFSYVNSPWTCTLYSWKANETETRRMCTLHSVHVLKNQTNESTNDRKWIAALVSWQFRCKSDCPSNRPDQTGTSLLACWLLSLFASTYLPTSTRDSIWFLFLSFARTETNRTRQNTSSNSISFDRSSFLCVCVCVCV